MSTLTHSDSTLRQYWVRGLKASHRPLLWIGLVAGLVGATTLSVFLSLDVEGMLWVAEIIAPLLAAVCAARLASEHETSGVSALLGLSSRARAQVLRLRILTSMAFGLGVGLLGILTTSLTSSSAPAVGGLLMALPASWFLALLASYCAGYFRSAALGIVVAMVPWVASLLWGFSHSPLLSLQVMRALSEQELFFQAWPLNRLVLLVLGACLWVLHGRLRPASVRARAEATPLRLVGLAAVMVASFWVAGVAFSLCVGPLLLLNGTRLLPLQLGKHLERYRPVPAAALMGPAFAAYTGNGLAHEQPGAFAARVTQLTGALERWPRSVWAPAMRLDLAQETESLFTQTHFSAGFDYPTEAVSGTNPGVLVALLDPKLDTLTEESRTRIAMYLARQFPTRREGMTAVEHLLDHPGALSLNNIRTLAMCGARPAGAAKQPHWLLYLAEVYFQNGRNLPARTLAIQARTQARKLVDGSIRPEAPLTEAQIEGLRMAEITADQLLRMAERAEAEPKHRHRH